MLKPVPRFCISTPVPGTTTPEPQPAATDCISEGQNLQDCDYCINYDIHWNPVRIIQRFGRIDRIGSQNKYIQLVNFWPDVNLDDYLQLSKRVKDRMLMVDQTTGAGDNPIEQKQIEYEYRSTQIEKLFDGKLQDFDDIEGNINISDLGFNDFRIDLSAYLKENNTVTYAPKGLHAVVQEDKSKGIEKGVIFVLRNLHADIKLMAKNILHSYYLVYVNEKGDIILDNNSPKAILDIIRHLCKDLSKPIEKVYKAFNKETQDGFYMEKYSKLLEKAILCITHNHEEKVTQSLFTPGPTTALKGSVKGIDDFELICFLVIK